LNNNPYITKQRLTEQTLDCSEFSQIDVFSAFDISLFFKKRDKNRVLANICCLSQLYFRVACNTYSPPPSLSDWLTELDAENQKFKELMAQRYTEVSQRPTTRMKAARAETDKAFRAIFRHIEALALVNGPPTSLLLRN
jgi:hypothetical protein